MAYAILSSIVLVLATVSASLQQAYASSFVFREPPYANKYASPNGTCQQAGEYLKCATASYTSGTARIYSHFNGGYQFDWSEASHNVNPPVANPLMSINQFRNLYFHSAMDDKFLIAEDPEFGQTGGEMRYGGWTAFKRPADGVWVKHVQFWVSKSTPGVYDITNTDVTYVKGYNAGQYSMGSSFVALAWGWISETETAFGTADAWSTTPGYGFESWMLAIEWCDGGVC